MQRARQFSCNLDRFINHQNLILSESVEAFLDSNRGCEWFRRSADVIYRFLMSVADGLKKELEVEDAARA